MILAGMDVSGNTTVGNHKYLSIVIGTENSINSLFRKIGYKKIHKKSIRKNKEQKELLEKIIFDNHNNMALCLYINRNPIMNKVKNMRKIKRKRISEIKILRTYHYLLFQSIRDKIELFLTSHNVSITDIVFQCDSDCRNLIRDCGLKYSDEGIAHQISDVVAWANNKQQDPSGVISLDLSEELEKKLLNRIFR